MRVHRAQEILNAETKIELNSTAFPSGSIAWTWSRKRPKCTLKISRPM